MTKVLIVEDDRSIVDYYKGVPKPQGYSIDVTSSIDEVTDQIRTNRPAVVDLDMNTIFANECDVFSRWC